MQANDGLLRYEDMAAFKLQPEEPVSTDYHGYKVYKPGFWSQGPAMIEALNILEGFDLRSMGFNSAEYIHTLSKPLKLAYADRDTYYGDPKFNQHSRRHSALEELRRGAPQADHPHRVAWISCPARSTETRQGIPPRWTSRASRSTMR